MMVILFKLAEVLLKFLYSTVFVATLQSILVFSIYANESSFKSLKLEAYFKRVESNTRNYPEMIASSEIGKNFLDECRKWSKSHLHKFLKNKKSFYLNCDSFILKMNESAIWYKSKLKNELEEILESAKKTISHNSIGIDGKLEKLALLNSYQIEIYHKSRKEFEDKINDIWLDWTHKQLNTVHEFQALGFTKFDQNQSSVSDKKDKKVIQSDRQIKKIFEIIFLNLNQSFSLRNVHIQRQQWSIQSIRILATIFYTNLPFLVEGSKITSELYIYAYYFYIKEIRNSELDIRSLSKNFSVRSPKVYKWINIFIHKSIQNSSRIADKYLVGVENKNKYLNPKEYKKKCHCISEDIKKEVQLIEISFMLLQDLEQQEAKLKKLSFNYPGFVSMNENVFKLDFFLKIDKFEESIWIDKISMIRKYIENCKKIQNDLDEKIRTYLLKYGELSLIISDLKSEIEDLESNGLCLQFLIDDKDSKFKNVLKKIYKNIMYVKNILQNESSELSLIQINLIKNLSQVDVKAQRLKLDSHLDHKKWVIKQYQKINKVQKEIKNCETYDTKRNILFHNIIDLVKSVCLHSSKEVFLSPYKRDNLYYSFEMNINYLAQTNFLNSNAIFIDGYRMLERDFFEGLDPYIKSYDQQINTGYSLAYELDSRHILDVLKLLESISPYFIFPVDDQNDYHKKNSIEYINFIKFLNLVWKDTLCAFKNASSQKNLNYSYDLFIQSREVLFGILNHSNFKHLGVKNLVRSKAKFLDII